MRTVYYPFYFAVFGERVHALESSTRNVALNGGPSTICRRRRTFCVVLGFLQFVSSSLHVSAVAAMNVRADVLSCVARKTRIHALLIIIIPQHSFVRRCFVCFGAIYTHTAS